MSVSLQIFIELTTYCNFNCDFCPYHLLKRQKSKISLESLSKVLDSLKGQEVEYVMFSAIGEPLLYSDLVDACRMVKDRGYKLNLTTNGALLKSSHRILDVDALYISFRSSGSDSFVYRRANISFEQYVGILSDFLRDNIQNTVVYFSFNDNVKFTEFYKKNWMGVLDYTDPKMLENFNMLGEMLFPGLFKPCTVLPDMDSFIHIREKLNVYFTRLYSWSNVFLPSGDYRVIPAMSIQKCDYNDKHVVVFANGDVTTCCMDYDGEMIIGNVFNELLSDILKRRSNNEQLVKYEMCKKCRGRIIKSK